MQYALHFYFVSMFPLTWWFTMNIATFDPLVVIVIVLRSDKQLKLQSLVFL